MESAEVGHQDVAVTAPPQTHFSVSEDAGALQPAPPREEEGGKKEEEDKEEEEEVATWKTPGDGEHDDFYIRFLRKYYMPLLVRHHVNLLCLWFIVFIICIIYGPAFLSSTRSNLDLPKGTPSAEATDAFQANFPQASQWAPLFVVAHSETPGVGVRQPYTQSTLAVLNNYVNLYPTCISSVGGYYNYQANGLSSLATTTISKDNSTMLVSVNFQQGTDLTAIYDVATRLLKWSIDVSTPSMSFYATGLFALFNEMQAQTSTDFTTIDEIVLPICIVILGITLNSYRHMGLALINLINTILLAFGILIPISKAVDINPFSPSILLSLGIAVCFDYTLFMLTRFKEERLMAKRSLQDSVFHMLCNSGHVVLLSGSTLFVTFIILLLLPQNFLESVGVTCAVVTMSAVIVNMSITPCMLLSFACMSHFDPYPYCKPATSCCCKIPAGQPWDVSQKREEDFQARAQVEGNWLTKALYFVCGRSQKEEEGTLEMMVAKASIEGGGQEDGGDKGDELTARQQQQQPEPYAYFSFIPGYVTARSPWFNLSFFCTKYAYTVMLVTIGITIPFLVTFLNFQPTSDAYLIYLQTSRSLKGLKLMSSVFPEGALSPYMIVMATGTPNAVLTANYFTVESKVVHYLIDSESKYVDASGITALSYFQSHDVSLDTALQYLDSSSTLGQTTTALAYRTFVGGLMSQTRAASMIQVALKVAPNAQIAVGFIEDVRKQLTSYTSNPPVPALPVKMYLFGGYTSTLDVQNSLFELVPIMVAITIIIVLFMIGISFGSVMLALRLAFTTFISLCWTYGLTVLVYQPGDGQDVFSTLTPTLKASTGIYWIIPVMSFSILVGLALDYDIFLCSRVVEFRRMGWSDRAAVCLAVEKTASIITSAGTIMSISFAGLLIPKTIVLNQYGFTLFIGVAFDTFLIRTIVVPATITVIGGDNYKFTRINWWPGVMPPLAYATEEEEDAALLRGLWVPDVKAGSQPLKLKDEEGKMSEETSGKVVVVASG